MSQRLRHLSEGSKERVVIKSKKEQLMLSPDDLGWLDEGIHRSDENGGDDNDDGDGGADDDGNGRDGGDDDDDG